VELAVAALILIIGVGLVIALVALANRRLAGRVGRLDGLSEGVARGARAAAMRAGVPPSSDLGVHAPARPDRTTRRRRKRR
jgi:hypothetical protein